MRHEEQADCAVHSGDGSFDEENPAKISKTSLLKTECEITMAICRSLQPLFGLDPLQEGLQRRQTGARHSRTAQSSRPFSHEDKTCSESIQGLQLVLISYIAR